MNVRGIVLHPRGLDAWWRLMSVLDRRPARWRNKNLRDLRHYVVLYGGDVSTALEDPAIEVPAVTADSVVLADDTPDMLSRARADKDTALALYQDSVVACPLCVRPVRLRSAGVLTTHTGRERAADEIRLLDCRASGMRREEAEKLAAREREELHALQLRAHP